jgi:hypothetical protein
MFWQVFHFLLFLIFLDRILGVILGLYMDGHLLTNMVWSEHFSVDDRVYHLQVLFCSLLLLVYMLLRFLRCLCGL